MYANNFDRTIERLITVPHLLIRQLMLSLLITALPVMAVDYRLVTGDAKRTRYFYVDHDSVIRKGSTVRVWEIQSFLEPDKYGVQSARFETEYDCSERRARTLASSMHKGTMADGEIDMPTTASIDQRWSSIPPNTISEVMWRYVCINF